MRMFRLVDDAVRWRAVEAVRDAPVGHVVKIQEPTRSLDQNAAQWVVLQAFADQLDWPVNGERVKLSPEEWKDLLSAAFTQERRIAEGLRGGHVFLGARTSTFSRSRFSEWLDFLHQVAAERGVRL
jgi:hypothetical protein